jgi:hypothetical protein
MFAFKIFQLWPPDGMSSAFFETVEFVCLQKRGSTSRGGLVNVPGRVAIQSTIKHSLDKLIAFYAQLTLQGLVGSYQLYPPIGKTHFVSSHAYKNVSSFGLQINCSWVVQ